MVRNAPAWQSELTDIAETAIDTVRDSRLVWCLPSVRFESTISRRRAVVLGRPLSPWFLGKATEHTPAACQKLLKPRLLHINQISGAIAPWVPLLEDITQAGESALVVTEEIDDELLQLFAINAVKDVLSCCVSESKLLVDGGRTGAIADFLPPAERPPQDRGGLPQADSAYVRRTATVVLPAATNRWEPWSQDVIFIWVGGDSYDDQRARCTFLLKFLLSRDLQQRAA